MFDNPDLISSLALFSESRQPVEVDQAILQDRGGSPTQDPKSSTLFLRVTAAADYFSSNKTLMRNVPLVHVDISKVTC